MLPPELLRKGRFDEIFSVTLPTVQERAEIFRIHLAKRGRGPLIDKVININDYAAGTDGWSGSEIESVIKEGLFTAFSNKRELSTLDLTSALEQTVPLSKTMKSKLQSMTDWCKGRTRSASRDVSQAQAVTGRMVQA